MVDLQGTIGPAYVGFTIGAILYGITILQAYQYYSNSKHSKDDSICRKSIIGGICVLDTVHIAFASYLIYILLVEGFGGPVAGKNAVWSFKVMASDQVMLIAFVHWLYLYRIWILTKQKFFYKSILRIQYAIFLTAATSLVAAIGEPRRYTIWTVFGTYNSLSLSLSFKAFLIELQGVNSIFNFPISFQYMIYAGIGITVLIDCGIAASLCMILRLRRRSDHMFASSMDGVLQYLIQYCVATGLVTSLASLSYLVLYVAFPNTVLYLITEFSITRLYANSMLALFNSRHRLREKLEVDAEVMSAHYALTILNPCLHICR
ncbi:hypothetical protein BDQ17DRAFT_1545382 [Cyathus striatus]|nr:hypothetical protein BDQ17DRAFT_1545382 [Cyathus striatus]